LKYTLCITQQCNMSCKYCYIGKSTARMSLAVAKKIVDFIFETAPAEERIDIGFFGGEPLLEFELIKTVTKVIENHPAFDANYVDLAVVTNGTIFSDEIADFMNKHNIGLTISCDGPPSIQNLFRRFPNGKETSNVVETTVRNAIEAFSLVPVNAVYHPQTFRHLPQTVEYLSSLGIKQIYLSPDFSALWTKEDADLLPEVYGQVAEQYIAYYLAQNPHFISLIDSKITVILRGGYDPLERCQMGKGEFAFAPDGKIYPCERLIGSGGNEHCIGNINEGLQAERKSCNVARGQSINAQCLSCGIRDYCMNWCGCSNYFSSGYYNRVSPFLCASEKAAIRTSFHVFQVLNKTIGATFADHLAGFPIVNSNNTYRRR
jgi:uncharacterized protein